MATPQASSRLELLQARFQQKQLQEKEQKLLQLYDQQQQRAYQVVQRSSASSNGSNHGSSISHHTVTKTTTTSHTTSTSQGGKVRQMFDERRQTTVKGIDRSYPLEPLENKPRKQTNGNVAQKNGNLTVNRQSVTVKRVARADVNSNLNGGKPIVSYHEEITRDSYGSDGHRQPDDDEFGNENHITQYGNGNQTHDEEVLDEDTIERNRMMAKLHLMEYDETLKHRVKNDLESEQFPEDFMVEVPDKLPKRNVTKKLSPAEARLERFKNTNAKRSNSITKNPSTVLKKRSDPIHPAKSTSSEDEGKTRIRVILDRGSRSGSPRKIETNVTRNMKDVSSSLDSEKNDNFRSFCKKTEKLIGLKVDEEPEDETGCSGSPKFFCKESEKSATTYAIDSKTREKLSSEFSKNVQRRSESPKFDSKSGRRFSNQLSKDRIKRSESPKFFCTESEKSATTYAIDSKTREKLSPDFSKNTLRKRESPGFLDSKISRKSPDQLLKDRIKRSESPKFFCKESEKSATTYAIDPKTRGKLFPEFSKNTQRPSESPECLNMKTKRNSSDQLSKEEIRRSESPKFFCTESEKSATTYAIDSKTREKLSPDSSKNTLRKRESPGFLDSKISRKSSDQLSGDKIRRSESPKFFCTESEKSATTYAIDSKTREKLSPDFSKNTLRKRESPEFLDSKISRKSSDQLLKDRIKRSESPKFFCKESEKSVTTYAIDSRSRSTSPDFVKIKPRHEESVPVKSSFETKTKSVDIDVVDRKVIPHKHHKTGTEMDSKSTGNKMPDVFERLTRGRSSSPKFSQTTASATKDSKLTSNSPDIFHKHLQKRNKDSEPIRTTKSKSPNLTKKLGRSGTSPQFFISDSERSATIMLVTPETILKEKPESLKSVKREQDSKSYASNSIIGEPRRRTSEEIVDASSRHNIRSSVSRFFTEQCEKASRNLEDNVRSTKTDENLRWSRDSSPLSLKDARTPDPNSPQFSRAKTGKSVSTTAIDGSRDLSLESRKNSRSASPKSSKPKSTEDVWMKRSGPRDTRFTVVKRSKSKSPDFKVSSLQSTRLIRDAIKRQNNKDRGRCDSRVSNETEGTHEAFDEEVDELPATGSSPKSCTSVEVDAEILEITMPDQYTEHRPLRGDKTREGSSTERLFTYSVCEPGSKRGSLSELSKGDQGKTDRWEASGRKERAGRNAKSIPSPTNSLDVRGSKLRTRENGKRAETEDLREKRILNEHENLIGTKGSISRSTSSANHLTIRDWKRQKEENREINGKSGAVALGSRVDGILGKYDDLKSLKGCVSRSSSPANSLTICDSKRQKEEDRKIGTDALRSREKRIFDDNLKQSKRNKSNGSFLTNKLIFRGSKRAAKVDNKSKCLQKTILNESDKEERLKRSRNTCDDSTIPNSKRRITVSTNRRNEIRNLREKTPSPVQTKQKKGSSRSPLILRSMKLVQSAIKGKSFEHEEKSREIIGETRTFETKVNKSGSIESRKSNSTIVYIKDESSSSKNYERTDSVESALKRFDSIGTESVQSATEKNRTLEESKTISLKALDRIDADHLKMKKNESKTQERFPRARISSIGSKSPVCKRKLFQDVDSGDETETGSSKSRYSSFSRTIGRKTSKKSNSECSEAEEIDEASTDTSLSVSVKQLRSIEDIRKSIDPYSDTKGTSTKSAIANNTLKRSNETQSRPTNPDDRAGSRKGISGNLTAKNHALGDAERSSIKCAMRFFRVTKSPSPDSTKTTEPGNRARRNVLSSPSKSPDTVARRPSTEMKAQEAKTLKRPTLMKGTEPIGNRKTMTATSTSKSTDVVDGAILENGVHLRDQTAETKYDNDPIEAKKSDAFVIEFDEQSPKENDAPVPRKSLLRKQSIDKQTPSVQSGRPPSSVSSTSSGSSMQGQVSGSKGKMASKARTPSSGVTHRGSASSKSGGIANVVDNLIPCKMCGRRFAQDRVTLHEQICTKTTQKKRKQFDTMLYRVKGTDLEPFVRKGLSRKLPEKSKKPEPKSNWRRKHEDFINAIRSAKQVQAHLAAGGKLSDLPPPPPCDTSDYVQCPHCGRKFNQSAAERHIPKCEKMLHNKPIHSRAPKPKR